MPSATLERSLALAAKTEAPRCMKKTILITGSTDGIGKLAAILLAKEGHVVILHGRDADKLAAVRAEITKLSPEASLRGFVADLSDLDAVQGMTEFMKQGSCIIEGQ